MSRLEATVGIKNGPFKNGLNEMRAQAKAFGNDIKSTIAGAFAFGAVASFVSNFVGEMARVKDLSDRLGESSETIQRVGVAAKMSGSDLESTIKILTKLTLAAGENADKFEAAGVNGAAFANAGMEDKLLMLAKAYDEANGSQDKMLKLMALLGPKGQDMLIMLSGGADAIKEAMDGAAIASDTSVAAMARLDDAIETSKQTLTSWAASAVDGFEKVVIGLSAIITTWNSEDWGASAQAVYDKTMADRAEAAKAPEKNKPDFTAEEAKAKADAQKDADRAAKSLDEEMLKLARSRMDAEEKIASLKKEQAQYAEAAKNTATPKADQYEAAKKVLEIQQQIDAAESEGAKKSKELKDAIDKDKLDKMSPEDRLAELKRKQAEMNAEAEKTPEKAESKQKKIDALKMNGEIEAAQKEIDDKKKKEADDAEKKRKEIADAEGAYAEEQNKQRLDKMSPLERIKELKRQQKELNDAAAKDPDAKSRAEKKTEALKLNDEIDKAQKELDGNKGGKKPTVVTSSLASIGGGGRTYIGADPALTESRRQTSLLQQLVRNTSQGGEAVAMTSKNPF